MNTGRTVLETLLGVLVLAVTVSWWWDASRMSRREAAYRLQLGATSRRIVMRTYPLGTNPPPPPLLDVPLSTILAAAAGDPRAPFPLLKTRAWVLELAAELPPPGAGGYAVGRADVGAPPARPRSASPRNPR